MGPTTTNQAFLHASFVPLKQTKEAKLEKKIP